MISNFQNNEYDIMIEGDIIFHATSGAIDVSEWLHFTTVIKFEICYYFTGITDLGKVCNFDIACQY